MLNKITLSLFILALLAGTGCTVVHTVPLSAHQGDTIIVSIGSPSDASLGNIDLTYTPVLNNPSTGMGAGIPIPIPDSNIRSIFNLYPDKTSAAWLYSDADLVENNAGHGPWTTVLAVDLPNDGSLWATTGTLQVNTTAAYPGDIPSANGENIALEILAGTGTSSSFDYLGFGGVQLAGDLTELEPMKRLQFKPDYTGFDGTNTYGAVEIKIGINKSGISEDDFNIIFDDKIGTIQTRNVTFGWNAERFETTVYLISPTGELQYSDVNFSIISNALQSQFEAGDQIVGTDVTINSVIWYDIDGDVAVPAGPQVNVVNLTGT